MKNIEIKIDKNTRMVDLSKTIIGNDSENLQGKIVFSFVEDFVNGQARLHYEINGKKNWVALDKVEETYELPIKSVLTKKGQIDMQLVITEGVEEENVPVFKSNKFYMYCNSSINAVEEEPIGYDSWLEIANIKLNQVDNLDVNLENNILTVTKKDGTTQTENVKGDKGDKGDPGEVDLTNYYTKEDIDKIIEELPTDGVSMKETVLYEDLDGTTEDITLNDNSKNYEYIEIYFRNEQNHYNFTRVYQPHGKSACLMSISQNNDGEYRGVYFRNKMVFIDGVNITTIYSNQVWVTGNTQCGMTVSSPTTTFITKVIGYK